MLSMLLASINQIFSLLDPFIYGKIIDRFASHSHDFTRDEFIRGVAMLIGAGIGVAMVSRIAKAFQDYFINLIIQKLGADIYTDGLKHTLKMPFSEFEDQRSGETLNVLQKVRTDTEKFISNFINILFTSVIGIGFVIAYTINVHGSLIAVYLVASVLLGVITNYLSRRIKKVQTNDSRHPVENR